MMKHNIIAALLLAAVTMMTVGCNKEDNIVPIEPKAKVSRIYVTNTTILESYNDSTQTWDTMYYLPGGRSLNSEFFWTGDRLDSLHKGMNTFHFVYDNRGRLVNADMDYLQCFDIEYNTDGNVSRVYKCDLDDGDTVLTETYLYFWSGGKLQRLESDIWAQDPSAEALKHETRFYTWAGDNVAKTVRHSLHLDGSRDTLNYYFEVNNLANPFYGFPFWQIPYYKMIASFDGTDGLNKNMVTRYYNEKMENQFEYTTTGGRVTGIHEVYTTTNPSGLTRSLSVTDYEIEYVN